MNDLPPELLGPIILLACTDGGRTGCALSRTSKYLRAASRSMRFHSVALISGKPSQVVQFFACYTAECERTPEMKPRVRQLCLSSARKEQPSASAEFEGEPGTQYQDTEAQKEAQRYLRDVMFLIQTLASDLEILCLIDPGQSHTSIEDTLHFPTLKTAGFPCLLELVIIGEEPTIESTSNACIPLYPRLQSLRRVILPQLRRQYQFVLGKHLMIRVWQKRVPGLVDIGVLQMNDVHFEASSAELLQKVRRERKIQLSSALTELIASLSPRRRRLSVSSDPCG
ncbi:hypothetical protein TRAPUB_19 [Trametes pubescens]|uniref:Uncharacterized protein n=1 Tax=Trametes pubescens TaxID=154538 RepID=A0A1M2VNE4_TRAPU|nr:hypothetical protein TRAPUB_19 [Trametes pubescens]